MPVYSQQISPYSTRCKSLQATVSLEPINSESDQSLSAHLPNFRQQFCKMLHTLFTIVKGAAMFKYLMLVPLACVLVNPSVGLSQTEDEYICPMTDDLVAGGAWTPDKAGTYKALIIHVVFPGTLPASGYIDEVKLDTVPEGFSTFVTRQSRGLMNMSCEVLVNPDTTVTEGWWEAEYPVTKYAHPDSVATIARYDSCYGTGLFDHAGELQAEILDNIGQTLNLYDPNNNNPFDGVTHVIFYYQGQALWSHYVEYYYGGYGYLKVNKDCFPFLSNATGDYAGNLNGVAMTGYLSTNYRLAEMKFAHEFGHNIGLFHTYCSTGYDHEEESIYYSVYSSMRMTLIKDQGFLPYHLTDLIRLGWVDSPVVVPVGGVLREHIYDIRDGGNIYKMNIDSSGNQYFLIAYHGGINEDAEITLSGDPLYRSTGLEIWHNKSSLLDLESASGRYSDPNMWDAPGYWQLGDSVSGYDNHDVFPVDGGQDGLVPYDDARLYPGDESDFFNIVNGTNEFSYKTNPNTFGQSGYLRRSTQNQNNSMFINIVDNQGDYLIVDMCYAPYENITSPNGGELVESGQPIAITWTNEHPIISTVDILLSRDGGQTYPVTIVQGTSALSHSYTWTPADSVATEEAIIKIVYHNSNSSYTCEDKSDSTFTVIPESVTQYVNKSTSTNLDYAGTPYSSAVLDYNHDGKTDLFVSIKDEYSKMYLNTSMTGDGVPDFSDVTATVFATSTPQPGLRGVSIADYDNDGDEDIFAAAATDARLYSCYCDTNQAWVFVDVASSVGISSYVTDTWSGTWGDYDQDDDVDLYVTRAQTSGGSQTPSATNVIPLRDYLLKNNLNINGHFVDASSAAGGMTTSVIATITASWADIDDDGDLDLLVPSIMDGWEYETAKLYTNNGNGTFTQNFTSRFGNPNLWHISGMSWFDADSDADLDVAFSAQPPSGTPIQRIYINDAGYFTEYPINLTLFSSGVNAFDHDLDGHMDLLYSPMSSSDTPHLIQNISSPVGFECRDITSTSGLANVGRVDGVVVSDFNSGGANTDGDLDLFLGRPESSGEYFFRASKSSDSSDSPVNHSVSVKLFSGGPNNKAAIGARVVASYNGNDQVQQVDGGSGHGGQNDRILTFGLGDYDGSVDLTIKWPLGYTQYETVPADSVDTGRPVEYEDETPVTIVTNSLQVDYVHQPSDGKLEWTLIWDTNYNSKAILDAAEINGPGWENPWVVYPQTSQIVRLTGGGYRHTMVISDFDCAIGSYSFKVRSSTDATTGAWSGTKSKTVRFCLAN